MITPMRVFVLIFILSWLIPLIGLLILMESKGPVFFAQKRSGKGNKEFWCLKFRSMKVNDQANEKMDEAIIRGLYQLYNHPQPPKNIMPMNIRELGNSSVATIPTLLDMVRKGHVPQHTLQSGDIVLFASVGAGMNINAVCYKI